MTNHSNEDVIDSAIDKALEVLREWADDDPLRDDPSAIIEKTSQSLAAKLRVSGTGDAARDVRKMIAGAMWEEWDVIEDERELLTDFEDDVD
ncbi:MAG: hypothetical protein OEN01_12110 [Candidatus Krumholzibacteria bacterium]|nr:hypothetical protein [Candidatus Krumholzibacteria bacterium]